jgi:hypothetical protein
MSKYPTASRVNTGPVEPIPVDDAYRMACEEPNRYTRDVLVRIALTLAIEVERARRREEAATTVARLWDGAVRDTSDANPLWSALDELARAHGDQS